MGAERSEGPSHQLRDPQTQSPVPSLSAQSLPDSHFGVWMESCHPQPGSSRCSVPGPGPPGTSDPKPFPASQQHRLLVAPPLPSYLPPDFVLGVLLSSPTTASDAPERVPSSPPLVLPRLVPVQPGPAQATLLQAHEDPILKTVPRRYVPSLVLSSPGPSPRAIKRLPNQATREPDPGG